MRSDPREGSGTTDDLVGDRDSVGAGSSVFGFEAFGDQVRQHDPADAGWARALYDPAVSRALQGIHAAPATAAEDAFNADAPLF